ncbi:glycosyltransferase [Nocardioides sp. DS6]|uniref:Glycosyltransferase n=1 Tax=Nocardioides eburneus TaxID=3231482 RepID=A0ABV3SYP7_9ACTN
MTTVTVVSAMVAVACGLLFLYPYVIYPLTLRLLPKKPLSLGEAGTDGAGFALFFCAYNEARVMPDKLANIRDLKERYPNLQVFAYDDASSDGTLQLLQAEPDLVTVVRGSGRTGKAHGMKQMVAQCRADYLVFTDANVILDVDCVAELGRYYADERVGGVGGSLHYISSAEGTATEAAGGLYWRLEEWSKALESATGNVMGADGSIFSVRRELYPDFPDTVQDDFTVSMAVVFAGKRLVKAPSVVAYERLVSDRADEARRKVRIAARAFHTHTVMKSGREAMSPVDKYKYAAHKMLRWWGAVPVSVGLLAALVFLASVGVPGLIALAAATVLTVAARVVVPKSSSFVWDLLVAVMSTLLGVLRARRGETFAVWTPPATR